jgi:hypothetical protein
VPTTGRHGNNLSSQRIDELDTVCLDFIARAPRTTGAERHRDYS